MSLKQALIDKATATRRRLARRMAKQDYYLVEARW